MNMAFLTKAAKAIGLTNYKVDIKLPIVFFNCLLWTPDVVLIDAMLINIQHNYTAIHYIVNTCTTNIKYIYTNSCF